jgi:hypothetical protein
MDVKIIDTSSLLNKLLLDGLVGNSKEKTITIPIDLFNRFLYEMNETSGTPVP